MKKKIKKSVNIIKFPRNLSSIEKQIEAILDKISKSGYESLSKEEKDFHFTAGKD